MLDGGTVDWEPRFTIHGYRYAEVSGWPGELSPGDVVSRVYHSDMERRGRFRSSDAAVNRLHENALWSLRSNFVDIPTDCPQRDERLGWTGDIQVFAPTAAFLYDVCGMLGSWLLDVAAEQEEFGRVPLYVPYMPLGEWGNKVKGPMAVWGDVAVLTPEVLYERTGDTDVLHRQYASATAWVDEVEKATGPSRIVDNSLQLGDWLDPTAPPESPLEAKTAPDLVATAYFAHSARRLAAIAALLGKDDDARHYTALADDVASAFADRYLDGGRATSDTQTAYSLISAFGLYPDAAAEEVGNKRLAELVRESGGNIATGFAGTPVVSDALTRGGNLAEAYLQLQQDSCPSWLYTVSMGATTIWERWDSMLPDGTVNNPGDMTSFNHYALGAVADWLHRVVAGLAPAEPGYRRIRFAPRPGGTLTSAGATHLTPYGEAAIDWGIESGLLRTTVTVPFGTSASVEFPGRPPVEVGPGIHSFETPVA